MLGYSWRDQTQRSSQKLAGCRCGCLILLLLPAAPSKACAHPETLSPALTVMASMNWSLQVWVPTTKAIFVFLISLSTVFCQGDTNLEP